MVRISIDQLEVLRKFEESFFSFFVDYIKDFSSQLSIEMVSDSKTLSWIKILLLNSELGKKIEISISNGINFEGKKINGAKFFIENDTSSFSIKDYCVYKKINNPISKDFFIESDNIEEDIENFLKECLEFLKIAEIAKMLNSSYWIDIPTDYSPYR